MGAGGGTPQELDVAAPDEQTSENQGNVESSESVEVRIEAKTVLQATENVVNDRPGEPDSTAVSANSEVPDIGGTSNVDASEANGTSEVRAESEKVNGEFRDSMEGVTATEKPSGENQIQNNTVPMMETAEEGPEEKMQKTGDAAKNEGTELAVSTEAEVQLENDKELKKEPDMKSKCFLLDPTDVSGNESGTEEDQDTFMKELETFHREKFLDFKPPKFYQEPLNCLKLWRAVVKLGGYERVTSLKLWRQVGESFHPPKTCTTVSWTFRGFYEKALLEYEKHKMRSGELPFNDASLADPISGTQVSLAHAPGSGRARRDAAARAMQGWHSQRRLGNGEVGDTIVKDQNPTMMSKREKQLKNIGFMKRKGSSHVDQASKCARVLPKPHSEIMVVDLGMPADWVKVNVHRMKDCYEVYALIPGLLREEVHVQTDPAGRLVISGQPEQQDNPWGVTPFKKVVSLPTRIDPHHTSAVATLNGQLFVRVPMEDSTPT